MRPIGDEIASTLRSIAATLAAIERHLGSIDAMLARRSAPPLSPDKVFARLEAERGGKSKA